MSWGPSPLARAGLLLFSVAVAGALIGSAWEDAVYSSEEVDLVEMSPSTGDELPTTAQRRTGPSAEERAVIQRATAGMPPYKDAVPEALAADFLDPGSRIAAAYFTTTDKPDQVLSFYKSTLLDAGIPIVQHRYNENAGYVGYMIPYKDEMHMVSALAQGGETTVFVSTGQVASFVENQRQQMPQGLPMPPGAGKPVVLTFRQEGMVRYSVMTDVETGQAQDVADFYRKTFESQGWKLESISEQNPLQMQVMVSREGNRATAMAQQQGAGVRLYLTLDQRQ